MAGRFIISLDFELLWGVRDHMGRREYGDAILGARAAIPEILRRFREHGVRATWATVGLLFCRTRREMLEYAPELRPAFADPARSPYAAMETEIGANETEDPYHFGRSLLDRIIEVEGQEIGTHTYAHFCWLEPGGTVAAFDADLDAAIRVAEASGIDLRSIVFPRNQFAAGHLEACLRRGLRSYRGVPKGHLHRPKPRASETLALRGARLLDALVPSPRSKTHVARAAAEALVDVPASRFLRPVSAKAPFLSGLHLNALLAEMRYAAREGRDFHLWWHPHNMGRNAEANLAQLDRILAEFRDLQEVHGLRSCTMIECAETAGRIAGPIDRVNVGPASR